MGRCRQSYLFVVIFWEAVVILKRSQILCRIGTFQNRANLAEVQKFWITRNGKTRGDTFVYKHCHIYKQCFFLDILYDLCFHLSHLRTSLILGTFRSNFKRYMQTKFKCLTYNIRHNTVQFFIGKHLTT